MSWRDIGPDPIRPMNDTAAQDGDINEPWEPALTGAPRRDPGDAAQPEVITCTLCNGDGVRHIGDGLEFETFECGACGGSGLVDPPGAPRCCDPGPYCDDLPGCEIR